MAERPTTGGRGAVAGLGGVLRLCVTIDAIAMGMPFLTDEGIRVSNCQHHIVSKQTAKTTTIILNVN